MQLIVFPDKATWKQILKRPVKDTSSLEATVSGIIQDVRARGDEAVIEYAARFDKVTIASFAATKEEFEEADQLLNADLKAAIAMARKNIENFHRSQLKQEDAVETMPGIQCWRRAVPIDKVGLYIPGGTAPLFSTLLMLGVPAKIAGCPEIILCSPPAPDGKLHPAILYTAKLLGIEKVFKTGGVQAIAAMAFGTNTIPEVYKIFGPGNQYVTSAKQLLQKEGMAIDMPAGPSELAIYADETADPEFVAADLLSQCEHGADSQVILVTCSRGIADKVMIEIKKQLETLPRKELALKALKSSAAVLLKDETEALQLLNAYAPEHLIFACDHAGRLAEQVINAGSVFLGHYSPESVGDYASGTNHVLPTNGYARSYSGVSVDSFVKKITFQQLTKQGLENIGPAVMRMAEAEGLKAHANAVDVRLKK